MKEQQWLALCQAWNQADIVFRVYKPLAFTAPIKQQLEARQAWLHTTAIAARQSLEWLGLLEDTGERAL
jgi:hypothetical protein